MSKPIAKPRFSKRKRFPCEIRGKSAEKRSSRFLPGMSKFIALDVGNVCTKVMPERCFEALGYPSDTKPSTRFLHACELLEKGKISERDYLDIFHKETKNRFSDIQLLDAWNMIVGEEIQGMYELLGEISGLGYRIIFFSNTSNIHIIRAFKNMNLTVFVTGGIYSFEVGAMKPDRKIYEAFEKKYGKPFFYVDDKPENIEAGKKSGWFSHQFISVDLLRKAFLEKHYACSRSKG